MRLRSHSDYYAIAFASAVHLLACDQLEYQPLSGAPDVGLPPAGVLTQLPSEGIMLTGAFGDSLVTLGRDIFIGDPRNGAAGINAGAVYHYQLSPAGYQNPALISAPVSEDLERFGESLAACDPFLFVAGDCGNQLAGCTPSVYIFLRDDAGGLSFVQRIDGPMGTNYGNRIACDAASLAVTSRAATGGNVDQDGAVYVYAKQETNTWGDVQRLTIPQSVPSVRFAERLAVSDGWLAVSNTGGAGRLFALEAGAWVDRSSAHASLRGSASRIVMNGDEMFWHTGGTALYYRRGSQWALRQMLSGESSFGSAADADDGTWAITAPEEGSSGEGAVRWYRPSAADTWALAGSVNGPQGSAGLGASAASLLNGLLVLTNEARQEAFILVLPDP